MAARRPPRRRPLYRRHPILTLLTAGLALTAVLGVIAAAMWVVFQPELWAGVGVLTVLAQIHNQTPGATDEV
jgi:hypothetical protein